MRLWPEHFDVAFEQGDEDDGRRATYGASPGDEHHPAPYLYVAPWSEPPRGPGWTATGFRGAELSYSALQEAADPRAKALDFFRGRRAALLEPPGALTARRNRRRSSPGASRPATLRCCRDASRGPNRSPLHVGAVRLRLK